MVHEFQQTERGTRSIKSLRVGGRMQFDFFQKFKNIFYPGAFLKIDDFVTIYAQKALAFALVVCVFLNSLSFLTNIRMLVHLLPCVAKIHQGSLRHNTDGMMSLILFLFPSFLKSLPYFLFSHNSAIRDIILYTNFFNQSRCDVNSASNWVYLFYLDRLGIIIQNKIF